MTARRRRDGTAASLLVLGFESADHALGAVDEPRARAVRATTAATATPRARAGGTATTAAGAGGDESGAWRDAFLQAPYLRDTLVAGGVIAETFETACTWDRFEAPRRRVSVRDGTRDALGGDGTGDLPLHPRLSGRARRPTTRSSRPARRGDELAQWEEIKAAASEALASRWRHDHPSPRGRPRPPALVRPPAAGRCSPPRCAPRRRAVDPAGILNPGVLIDPQ